MINKRIIVLCSFAILVILLCLQTCRISNMKEKNNTIEQNIAALQDTLKKVKNKDSSQTAVIAALEVQSMRDLAKFKDYQDESVRKLARLAEENKNLKGAILVMGSDTKLKDTIRGIEVVEASGGECNPKYIFRVQKGKWIDAMISANRESGTLDLTVHNEAEVSIGDESKWYQKPNFQCSVKYLNPYTDATYQRAATTSSPKPRRWGIGGHLGYGATVVGKKFYWAPNASVGINFNFIEFK